MVPTARQKSKGKQPLPATLPEHLHDDMVLNAVQSGVFAGVSEFTIRRLIAAGKLKAVQISERRKGCRVRDLKALIEASAAA